MGLSGKDCKSPHIEYINTSMQEDRNIITVQIANPRLQDGQVALGLVLEHGIGPNRHFRDTTRSIVVIWVKVFQKELMVEIFSKTVVRAIGKVFRMKFC